MAFFNRGYDQLDKIEERMESNAFDPNRLWRFWLKKGEEADIIFLDDNPPIVEEHQLKINGKWGNFFTCLKVLDEECPLCEAGDRPSTVGFYTIIDRREVQGKKGTYKDQVRVLPAKFRSLKQLKLFSKKLKGLTGVEFNVTRSDEQQSPAIGDVYMQVQRHSPEDIAEILGKSVDEVRPDWEKFLQPKSAEELQKLVGAKADEFTSDDEVDFD